MLVENIKSPKGNNIPNQFVITEEGRGALGNFEKRETFQSYSTVIAIRTVWADGKTTVVLDKDGWDYSRTTSKYRCIFLGESTTETRKKIKAGEYLLKDLNSATKGMDESQDGATLLTKNLAF